MSANNVVQIKGLSAATTAAGTVDAAGKRLEFAAARFLPPPPPPVRSQYDLYPLPFFNADARCAWQVKPTGNYSDDCETGKAYAIEFLKSCDGTNGWGALLTQIVGDMIRAGPDAPLASGCVYVNGIVVGFMCAVGRELAVAFLKEQQT